MVSHRASIVPEAAASDEQVLIEQALKMHRPQQYFCSRDAQRFGAR
jgi:hypothetical protein